MWNKDGTNILVALGQLAKVHEEQLSAASALLATNIPSGVEIQRIVEQLCGARERMQRCWRLRDELNTARFEGRTLEATLQNFVQELTAEEERRRGMLAEDKGENPGADYIEQESLDALQALRETLLEFDNVPPAELQLRPQ